MPGEIPACWKWRRPTAESLARLAERRIREAEGCRKMLGEFGPVPFPGRESLRYQMMIEWHRGRCAICGVNHRPTVKDHDHSTGVIRGFLCYGCNTREGGEGLVFDRYRELHPAIIFNVKKRYGERWLPAAFMRTPDPLAVRALSYG